MKYFTAILISFSLLLCSLPLSAGAAGADGDAGKKAETDDSVNADAVAVSAPSALLMEEKTGTLLYEKNAHEKRPCASITKVMTLVLVMEAIDSERIHWDDMVTASEHAASMGGSDIWLEPGETMSVRDMVKATVVASANDASVALAELISGSEESFVAKMNEKAKELGMKDTVFKNCNGLDKDGHITSAYDVALMSRELMKHEKIFEFTKIRLDELRDGKTQIVNTNKLLRYYDGITGLKTGTTSGAGACISATAERDGLSLIAVILGAPSGKERFSDAAKLLDHGFANYSMVTPEVPEEAFTQISVENGMTEQIRTKTEKPDPVLSRKGSEGDIVTKLSIPESITAPVKKGQIIGNVSYLRKGKKIAEYPVTAADASEEISFSGVFPLLLRACSPA